MSSDLLLDFSPIILVLYIFICLFYLYVNKKTLENKKLILWVVFISWVVVATYFFCAAYFSFFIDAWHHHQEIGHAANLLAIAFVLFVSGVSRTVLNVFEPVNINENILKNIFDFIQNCIVFYTCYAASFSNNLIYIFTGVSLASLNIFRILAFRIYDDIYKFSTYHDEERYLSKTGHPGHILIRGIFDQIPRAFLYVAFSFTVYQLIIFHRFPGSFIIHNSSGNLFVDFFYFNIVSLSTVGYGDIVPKSIFAKLVCSLEIGFGIIILATLVTIIVGRFQVAASSYKDIKKEIKLEELINNVNLKSPDIKLLKESFEVISRKIKTLEITLEKTLISISEINKNIQDDKIENGEDLMKYRNKNNISRKYFSSLCQISTSTIRNIEVGRSRGTKETWRKIYSAILKLKNGT